MLYYFRHTRRIVVPLLIALVFCLTPFFLSGPRSSARAAGINTQLWGQPQASADVPSKSQGKNGWNQFNYRNTRFNPYEHIINPSNVSTLQYKWVDHVAEAIYTNVAVVDGVAYVNDFNGGIDAFNAKTGATIWKTPTNNLFTDTSVAVADGMVYIGGNSFSFLYAFNAKTSKSVWTYQTGNVIASSATVANGIVYFGCNDDKVYALDAKTGKLLWTAKAGADLACSPAVANGVVYVAAGNLVDAFNEMTGALLWSYTYPDGQIYSSPAVANGVLYLGSVWGKVIALDAVKGMLLWTHEFSGGEVEAAPVVVNGILYIGALDGNLYAFDVPGTI